MKKILLALISVSLLLSFPSFAKDKDIEIKGELFLRGEYYLQEGCKDCDRAGALGKLELDFSVKKEKFELHFNPVLRADSFGFTQGVFREYGNGDRHESYVSVREGYALLKPWEVVQVGAGSRIFHWGVGEEINPTNFNPRRYLNLVEPEDLGLLSGWVSAKPAKNLLLEAVVSKSGTSQSPWIEKSWWFPQDLRGIRIVEPGVPDKPQLAGRVGWENERWKGYLSYFRGYHSLPAFELTFTGLKPEYFRIQVIGGNLSANLGWLTARMEAAYKMQEGGQDDYVQWLVGVDKYITWERGSLYVLLQYVREDVTKRGQNPFQALDLNRLLKNAVTLKTEVEYGPWAFGVRGAYDVGHGFYAQPKVSRWLVKDSLKISLGCDILQGTKGSAFGRYKGNDRVFAEVKWSF